MIKFFKRLIIIILVTITLVTVAGIIILETKKDLITRILIEELNDQLLTRVEVGEIKLTIFHRFLHVTANFNTVLVFNPDSFSAKNMNHTEGGDTLLFANRIYLDIDLKDLLRKEIPSARQVGCRIVSPQRHEVRPQPTKGDDGAGRCSTSLP